MKPRQIYRLNIGHNIPNTKRRNTHAKTLEAVRQIFKGRGVILEHRQEDSATERTTVLTLSLSATTRARVFFTVLAAYLEQDCIAWKHLGTGAADLDGPDAKTWKPFNPAYFLN